MTLLISACRRRTSEAVPKREIDVVVPVERPEHGVVAFAEEDVPPDLSPQWIAEGIANRWNHVAVPLRDPPEHEEVDRQRLVEQELGN